MKIISILVILSAFVLGMYDGGDVTGALGLLFIFGPSIFERKGKRKCIIQNARSAVQR